jgi:hypothetical protein
MDVKYGVMDDIQFSDRRNANYLTLFSTIMYRVGNKLLKQSLRLFSYICHAVHPVLLNITRRETDCQTKDITPPVCDVNSFLLLL